LTNNDFDVEEIAWQLLQEPGVRLRRDEPLKKHCTLRIGGPAQLFAEVDTVEDLRVVWSLCSDRRVPFHLLGLGSNVLFPDEGIFGITVRLAGDFRRIEFEPDGERVLVDVGAAVSLPQIARDTSARGLIGLEALSGFPSTVGGAVFMNAGCYGTEIKDVLVSAVILEPDGTVRERAVDELEPRYRETNLKASGGIVASARFALTEGDAEETMARLDDFNRRRWKSLPSGKPNVGSIFKNPPEDSAGRLIDECGLKGRTSGGAQISEKHANVIVNVDDAAADDVLTLMLAAHRGVRERFGIALEPEVVLCGSLRPRWRDEPKA